MITTGVIMAGGKGERFWPKSRKQCPKQFLSLTSDGKTMIQHTVERLLPIVCIEDIFVVTNGAYKSLVKEQLPNLPDENIILEPVPKNTAPCIALAAAHIKKKYGDAIMVTLPSDHLVKYKEMYLSVLKHGINISKERDTIVTLGITPSYPEIGYGYINFEVADYDDYSIYKVKKFVEKPSLELAREYVDSGKYLWNSGMFIFSVKTIMTSFQKFLPNLYESIETIEKIIGTSYEETELDTEFKKIESVSIDKGVMEKADNIYVLPATFGWDDMGSWTALERFNKVNDFGNIVNGNVVTVDVKNSIIMGEQKLIALVGVENIIVVDTEDSTLICAKDKAQDIKKVIDNLKICNRENYL